MCYLLIIYLSNLCTTISFVFFFFSSPCVPVLCCSAVKINKHIFFKKGNKGQLLKSFSVNGRGWTSIGWLSKNVEEVLVSTYGLRSEWKLHSSLQVNSSLTQLTRFLIGSRAGEEDWGRLPQWQKSWLEGLFPAGAWRIARVLIVEVLPSV